MISEELKSNKSLTNLDLYCDEKEQKKEKKQKEIKKRRNGKEYHIILNEINRERCWRFRSKDDKRSIEK